jgi:hypothetical protein
MLEVDGFSIAYTGLPWLDSCFGEQRPERNRRCGVGAGKLMRLSAGQHKEVSRA